MLHSENQPPRNLALIKDLSGILVIHTSHEALERKAELSPLETPCLWVQVRTSWTCTTFREKASCVMFRQRWWLLPALQTTSSVPPIFLAIFPGHLSSGFLFLEPRALTTYLPLGEPTLLSAPLEGFLWYSFGVCHWPLTISQGLKEKGLELLALPWPSLEYGSSSTPLSFPVGHSVSESCSTISVTGSKEWLWAVTTDSTQFSGLQAPLLHACHIQWPKNFPNKPQQPSTVPPPPVGSSPNPAYHSKPSCLWPLSPHITWCPEIPQPKPPLQPLLIVITEL